MNDDAGVLRGALALLHRVEDAFLALLLTTMVVLAPTQIALRVFFDSAISWGDPALRALVLWLGLMGAVAATRGDRHITIDVLSPLLSGRAQSAVRIVTNVFATAVCGTVAWHAWRFLQEEMEFGSDAFTGVPSWWVASVIPLAFGLMTLRFALATGISLRDTARGEAEAPA